MTVCRHAGIWLSLGGFQESGPDPDRVCAAAVAAICLCLCSCSSAAKSVSFCFIGEASLNTSRRCNVPVVGGLT